MNGPSRRGPLTETRAEYLITISDLSERGGEARVTDIATSLGVSKASVHNAVDCLKSLGFVDHARYGRVAVTRHGSEVVARLRSDFPARRKYLDALDSVTKLGKGLLGDQARA